jgi:hypothetical protein
MIKIFRGFSVLLFSFIISGTASEGATLEVLDGIEMHGFASSSYTYNFNDPNSRKNVNRIFDQDHNSFKFDVGELVLLKETANVGDVGFRTDISYGHSVPGVTKGAGEDFDVQQGYVSWHAPVGKGLQVDAGKFITHIGAEVIEGHDGWNYNFSRSFLFGLAIPFTHTGVRASYTINDQLSVLGMLANGWDNTTDDNNGKTFGAQVAYTPNDSLNFLFNWAIGDEQDPGELRNIFDIVADVKLTNSTSAQFNLDIGSQENSVDCAGCDANWWGLAGIVRHDYNDWFSINLRVEYFDDEDRNNQELWEFTITPEWRINNNLVLRAEYRHDGANNDVFDDGAGFADSQDTVAVNALFYF